MSKIANLWEQLITSTSSISRFIELIDEELAGLDHPAIFTLSQHLANWESKKFSKGTLPVMPITYQHYNNPKVNPKEALLVRRSYQQSSRETNMGQRVTS